MLASRDGSGNVATSSATAGVKKQETLLTALHFTVLQEKQNSKWIKHNVNIILVVLVGYNFISIGSFEILQQDCVLI